MRIDNNCSLQAPSYGRCLRVALLLLVMQLCAVTHLRAEDRIVVQNIQITPGSTQRLAIQMENAVAYTSFQVELYFPEGITPVVSGGKYSVSLSSRKTNHTVTANLISSGALRVLAYSMGNESFTGNSGDLLYIDIVSESSFKGPESIVVKNNFFNRTSDRKEVVFADTYCVAYTTPFVLGDADGNGSVTITDAVAVVNCILGNPSANFNKTSANVNGDFDEFGEPKITITDAVGVVNIILNQGGSAPPMDMKEPEAQPE